MVSHTKKGSVTDNYHYGHTSKYQRESSAGKHLDSYYGSHNEYQKNDYYGYQYSSYQYPYYDNSMYKSHQEQYKRVSEMPPPDSQLPKAGTSHSNEGTHHDGHRSGAATAAHGPHQYTGRGSGGISKS